MSMIKCRGLEKSYGQDSVEVKALDGLDLTVEAGEFVAILGPSGSGKSTLLHILGGVDQPDRGSVEIAGQDLSQLSGDQLAIFRRQQIGLVYQFFNLVSVLSAQENIVLPHLLEGKKLDQERLDQVLAYLKLENRKDHLPSQLSGGQQQRVAVGRALYSQPAVLLCDEPTGNLDRRNAKDLIALLRETNRQFKQTILLITHDEELAEAADRLISIEDGRIVSDVRTGS